MRKGLLQVYTGDGKGKTTAAVGLAVRSMGHGHSVAFIQFMKELGPITSGEVRSLGILAEALGVHFEHRAYGRSFIYKPKPSTEEVSSRVRRGLQHIRELLTSDPCPFDLIVMDEALSAVRAGVIDSAELEFLSELRPVNVELVMTGRDISEGMMEVADLITEMRPLKHPYDSGVGAREGIEF